MKIEHSKWKVDKVIEMYKNSPFTEFTLENLRPIRKVVGIGYLDIKNIILEHNNNTSAGHPTSEGDDIVRYSEETQRVKDKEP